MAFGLVVEFAAMYSWRRPRKDLTFSVVAVWKVGSWVVQELKNLERVGNWRRQQTGHNLP